MQFLDPFAEADEDTGETKQSQNYIHIRIQRTSSTLASPDLMLYPRYHAERQSMSQSSSIWRDREGEQHMHPERTVTDKYIERNGRKTLTTVQGLPKKFDQKKILKVIKKKFGTLKATSKLTHY